MGKRNRVIHTQQYTLPSSKVFAEERWTLLENIILAHVLQNFSENLEDMTTEHILQDFNEIITFSKMSHCTIQISDYIMNASHKTPLQTNGKLQLLSLQNEQHKNDK